MEKWRVLRSRQIVANQWIGVREDDCLTTRDQLVRGYYVVEKADFVMTAAINTRGELLLVRQYKHPSGEVVVECPAGYLNQGEEPVAAVVRELREETGYHAGNVRSLGSLFNSPGVMTNRAHLFLCTCVERVGDQKLDATEDIEILELDFDEALRRLDAGELVCDTCSAATILLASRMLANEGGTGRESS